MQQSIVSFYTDGFEYALTPSAYESYTPSQVRSMINGVKPDRGTAARGRTDLYRLVKEGNYAVLMLVKNDTWSPRDGDTYKLVLEQFSSTVVDAQVLSSTRSGGELLVRLAVLGDVSDVLYMRTCRAQLGEYVDCMEVPSRALYTQNDAVGVVIVTESRASVRAGDGAAGRRRQGLRHLHPNRLPDRRHDRASVLTDPPNFKGREKPWICRRLRPFIRRFWTV